MMHSPCLIIASYPKALSGCPDPYLILILAFFWLALRTLTFGVSIRTTTSRLKA